jgi:methylated-DNA-protein-cysteine methyltransferase related protein
VPRPPERAVTPGRAARPGRTPSPEGTAGAERTPSPELTAGAERTAARAHAVLDVVDAIPAGRVMTYGDIARYLGIPSARQVGQILARSGHEVPWQRVVMADGAPASHDPARHLARLRAERTPLRAGRVDLAVARWRPAPLDDSEDRPSEDGDSEDGPCEARSGPNDLAQPDPPPRRARSPRR